MTQILNMTPIEIGEKLLNDNNTQELSIIDEPYANLGIPPSMKQETYPKRWNRNPSIFSG